MSVRLLHQFLRRGVAVDARQRGVGHQITALGRGLENAFHQVVEDAVVLLLGRQQRQVHAMPFDGVADGALQPAGGELAFDQIILRARLHGLDGHGFVVGIAGGDDGKPRRFGLAAGKCWPARRHPAPKHPAGRHRKLLPSSTASPALQIGRRGNLGGQIPRLAEHVADRTGKPGIVLDEQNLQSLLRHSHPPGRPRSGRRQNTSGTMLKLAGSRGGCKLFEEWTVAVNPAPQASCRFSTRGRDVACRAALSTQCRAFTSKLTVAR